MRGGHKAQHAKRAREQKEEERQHLARVDTALDAMAKMAAVLERRL